MIASTTVTTIIAHALKKPLEDIYEKSKDIIGNMWEEWNAIENIRTSNINLANQGKIRTIACRDPVELVDIYYPAKIIINKHTRSISSLSDLKDATAAKRILLSGIAGQGKSTFLKFLWINEINARQTLPLFINLRDINNGKNLLNLIDTALVDIGINTKSNEKVISTLLDFQSTVLFLDGLDEVERVHLLTLKGAVREITSKHKEITILISSRPSVILEGVRDMSDFSEYKIAKFTETDFLPFLAKIGTPENSANNLVETLNKKENSKVKSIIETPLMLTLLKIVYGHKTIIPPNLPELYTEMFNVLAQTHDESKIGYVRQWATNLTVGELRKFFEAFCYASSELGSDSLSLDLFHEAHEIAVDTTGLRCTPVGFETDMVESICLMAKDGLNISFTHKSIQEFFCAEFIAKSKDKEFVNEFYKSINSFERLIKFNGVLDYLEQIDECSFVDNLLAKEWEVFCEEHKITFPGKITDRSIKSIIKSFSVASITNSINTKTKFRVLGMVFSCFPPQKDEKFIISSKLHSNKEGMIKLKDKISKYADHIKNRIDKCQKSEEKKRKALLGLISKKNHRPPL